MTATATSPHALYQWQNGHGYPVYLRAERILLEGRLLKLLGDLGFQEVSAEEEKRVSFARASTKVLRLTRASARVSMEVRTSDGLDRYGPESLRSRSGAEVYMHRHVGLMVFSAASSLWDLGLVSALETTEELTGLRVALNRYLSWALAPHGVVGFWGVTSNEGFVVMRQGQSFGEAVFVDVARQATFSSAGMRPMAGDYTILRADRPAPAVRRMAREELVSFLTTHTTYLSQIGLPLALKRATLLLGSTARGEWGGMAPQEGLSNG